MNMNNSEYILKNGNNDKVLDLLIKMTSFNMEDYVFLVQNYLSSAKYLVQIIKYKFNIEPDIILLKYANNCWYDAIKQNLTIKLEYIFEYISELSDDKVMQLLLNHNEIINDNNILIELLNKNYCSTFKIITNNCLFNIDENLMTVFKQHNIKNNNNLWNCRFVSKEIMYEFIAYVGIFTNYMYINNLHLLDNELDNLYKFLVEKKISEISIDIRYIKGSHEKELLKIYLLNKYNKIYKLGAKIIKYPELYSILENKSIYENYREYSDTIYMNDTPSIKIQKILKIIFTDYYSYGFDFSTSKPYNCIPLLYIHIYLSKITTDISDLFKVLDHCDKQFNKIKYSIKDKKNFLNFTKELFNKKQQELKTKNNKSEQDVLPILNN